MRLTPLALACSLALAAWPVAPRAQAPQPAAPVFRANTELVLVNVVVRDKAGAVVRGLTASDFSITEDNKPQAISTFDFEEVDRVETTPDVPTSPVLSARPAPAAPQAPLPSRATIDLHGRRLMVFYFDLSSMQPEEVQRSVKAAHDYVDRQLAPADLVALASFSTSLVVDQDFTADRVQLQAALDRYTGAGGQGFEEGNTGDSEGTQDNGTAFTADDSEFNLFNTDRRLEALESLSDALAPIEQKKSVIYFSSGMNQTGSDNQVLLRRMIDRAVRANVSIYASDMRGLQAIVPGGDATQASQRGTSAFSGASVRNQMGQMAATQDTLATIAEDTGGRAFFDSNTFGEVFTRVVQDTSAYYVLAYSSTNPARDGKFRRIKVAMKRPDLKLDYRSGYYAGRDFAHSTRDDREQQLQDQLTSDLSMTDLPAYATAAYFRLADNRFYVPVSVIVPGYQLPFSRTTDKNKATVDILGMVRDGQKRVVGRIRDTVRIAPETTDELKRKTVQYETGLELAPGKYSLKVVVRENQDGTFGAYETDVVVPDLKSGPVKVSSVVVGTSLEKARKDDRNPLATGGEALIPNVTHVVSAAQPLYFYYEVYDPMQEGAGAAQGRRGAGAQAGGREAGAGDRREAGAGLGRDVGGRAGAGQGRGGSNPAGPIRLVTSVSFFKGTVRAFETPAVEVTALNGAGGKSAVFRFAVPPGSLPAGLYTCQVNVVDDVAGAFVFPRMQLLVRK